MKQSLFRLAIAVLAALSGFLTAQLTGCGALSLKELDYKPTIADTKPAVAAFIHHGGIND